MTTSRQSGRKNKSVTSTASKSQSQPAGTTKTTTATQPPGPEQAAPAGAYYWTHDYDYVKGDLRKLLIVSVILFALIIVAGFFI
jgi:hypothetical protein